MKITELTEGLAGRQRRGRHERALKDVVTPLVNTIIERRREEWETAKHASVTNVQRRDDFLEGYPTVERYLRGLWEQSDFDEYIEPLLDELKKAAFDGYTQYIDTLGEG